jgi:hypothetical protein
MILMLIAFTSIILGLSVTFYVYCKRGMEDSTIAVRISNQRLALRAAINYLSQVTSGTAVYGNADALKYATAKIVDLNGSSPRGQFLGWYRIKQTSGADQLYVTAGSGPSNGIDIIGGETAPPNWTDEKWNAELRAWYLVKINPASYSGAGLYPAILSLQQVNPPPASGSW